MPTDLDSSIKEMVNIGVTAKIASPLYNLSGALQSSSTETDMTKVQGKYKRFLNEQSSTKSDDTLDNTQNLYRLKAMDELGTTKVTPSKLEFLLYRRPPNIVRFSGKSHKNVRPKRSHTSIKRLLESESKSEGAKNNPTCLLPPQETSLIGKLKKSLAKKKKPKPQTQTVKKTKTPKEYRIDVYPFDHGCAEYLRTTDLAPQLISELLAERANNYATKFWAEFFGSLHIGVAFVLTFFLQTYRFVLHCVVKSVIVGFLQMSSDYGLKPLLAVTFNGFVQPLLIFVHNIMSSVRDVVKPASEALDYFLKPLRSLVRSVRVITFRENRLKKITTDV